MEELVERVTLGLASYMIVEPSISPLRFVDRRREVKAVLDEKEKVVLNGMITVLYGPRGCGKTSLFKALHEVVTSIGDVGVDVVVVGSEREAWRAEKLYAPKTLNDVMREVEGTLGFKVTSTGEVISSITVYASKLISLIVGYIAYMLRGKRKVIIVLDEVKADSDERLAELRGWLEGFANSLKWDAGKYWVEKGGSISVIVLTSDALVSKIRYKVGSKVNWALIWNLPYDAMVDLSKQLELNIDSKLLWRLTGGNPRALMNIKTVGLEKWIEVEVLGRIWKVIKESGGTTRTNIWDKLRVVVENIDDGEAELLKTMEEHNVITFKGGSTVISDIPEEEWVGKYYAYQIPAYHHALKVITARRSLHVTPKDVIEDASSS